MIKLTDLLGIKYPILQGGMAWISEHKLAAAVSNAGGAGIIAGGNAPPEIIREEIRKARELTDKPFGVNIMLMSPNSEELAQVVIDEKVAFVTTGAGNPGRFMEQWKAAGIKVIPVIPSVGLAKRMERSGADAVVAEGMEAGGHIGETTTMCLVPQVVDAVSIPVIAAGGIADSRGIAAAFALGASGIQAGTVFLAAAECIAHQNYKDLVLKAKDRDTIVTGAIATKHPCRGLETRFAKRLLELEKSGCTSDEFDKMTIGSYQKAVIDGDLEQGSFYCGAIAGLVGEIRTCEEIIRRM
ncbi:MAG: DUF561 domain-containing protein, partial [Oscillospiraceae bacterium]|nr:DUF561 domain-containing protein [Oscillospiraceae bacterium]